MRQLLGSERRKVTSTLSLALVLPLGGFVSLATGAIYLSSSALDASDELTALSNTNVGGIFALLFGIVLMTSETRHGTLAVTLAVSPARTKLLVAKAVVAAGAAAAAAALTFAAQSALTITWLATSNAETTIGSGTWLTMFAGTVLAYALWAALGVGLGALVRDQTLAITAALVVLLLVEPVLGGVRDGVLGPFSAAQALQRSYLGGSPSASQATGGFVLLGYAVCLGVLGIAAFNGRRGVPR